MRIAISSRSANDKYRPLSGAGSIDGIPPPSLNHRLPAACDAPTASAACSLVSPFAISRQNARCTSRRNDGAPGDFIGDRPVNATIHPTGLPINTSEIKALRRPLEFTQYTSIEFGQVLDDHHVLQSVGSVGDAYDNALAESFVDTIKTELIRDRVWQTRSQLELGLVEYLGWFNDAGLHESLGDLTPPEFEALHAARFDASTHTITI